MKILKEDFNKIIKIEQQVETQIFGKEDKVEVNQIYTKYLLNAQAIPEIKLDLDKTEMN